jgi:hypothetical protein
MNNDYFGSDAQQDILRRGRNMYDVVGDGPQFTYYGRTVGLATPSDGSMKKLAGLARLQGNSNYGCVPNNDVPAMIDAASAEGLKPMHYARWEGAENAVAAARDLLASQALPDGLRLVQLDDTTPPNLQASFAQTALACGVLPPSLAALTGRIKPAVTLMACTADGQVASCAAASGFFSPNHPDSRTECWWGMLSTHPDWRGHRLSMILGAQTLINMHEAHGFSRFMTGVEPGNTASEAVCIHMGLECSENSILGVADPALVPGGRMTK